MMIYPVYFADPRMRWVLPLCWMKVGSDPSRYKTHLTGCPQSIIIIITMNDNGQILADELLQYQSQRVQGLVEETIQCCQMQTSYLSRKYSIPQAELRCLLLFPGERYLTAKGIAQKLDEA